MTIIELLSSSNKDDAASIEKASSLLEDEKGKYSRVLTLGVTPDGAIRGVMSASFTAPEAVWLLEHFKLSILQTSLSDDEDDE